MTYIFTHIFAVLALIAGFGAYVSYREIVTRHNTDGSLRINSEEGELYHWVKMAVDRERKIQMIYTVVAAIFTAIWIYHIVH